MSDVRTGFYCAIKPEWVAQVVDLVSQVDDLAAIHEQITMFLSHEFTSKDNLGKARQILLNTWYLPSLNHHDLWLAAVTAYKRPSTDKCALNWAMLLLAYPAFTDACTLIGKISLMQDTFTTQWLTSNLKSIWGDRPIVDLSARKILQTMKYMKTIENAKTGVYRIVSKPITDVETAKVMVMALLALRRKAYYEIAELSRVPIYFPFEVNASTEWLYSAPEIALGQYGGRTVVMA